MWLLSSPVPASAGNGGFVADDNVGRTTAVIGLVVVAFAVVAAPFVDRFAGGSGGDRR
jgi:hypothetical protein